VKRINPSAAMLGLEFHQLALIAGQLWFTHLAHTGARISWNSYNWWVFSYLTSFYTYFQEKLAICDLSALGPNNTAPYCSIL
jgi:hypothetical protein